MFRNPRENKARDTETYVRPSVGRPPSPPLSPDGKTAPIIRPIATTPTAEPIRIMTSVSTSKLPTIGRGSTNPKKSAATTPKAKGPPNGSILSFFKKSEDLEDELFVRSKPTCCGRRSSSRVSTGPDKDKENEGAQFQENGGSVKRRKLDRLAEQAPQNESRTTKGQTTAASYEAAIPHAGPFMVDEDSDQEDSTEHSPQERQPTEEQQQQQTQGEDKVEMSPIKSDPFLTGPKDAPSLKHEETSMQALGDFAEFEELGDFDEDIYEEGDENVERRWMEEQALLEAEQEALEEMDLTDGLVKQETTTSYSVMETDNSANCPICSISMAGISDQDAAVHVNNCLDGNPTPLPIKVASFESIPSTDEQPKQVDRFRKAPRAPKPGQANPFTFGEKPAAGGSAFSKLMSGHAEDAAWADAEQSEKKSFGKPAYQRTCPFYKILPGFNICVDAFRYGAVSGCQAYFLSHFHSDHYVGLTAQWCHGPIYCSKVTANLVKQQLRVDPKYVIALDWETKVEVPGTNGVFVTMISANHCPGSSLYLYEKEVGKGLQSNLQRVLHCGDFRACRAHIEHPLLRPDVLDAVSGKKRDQKIDVCYLDTTYLNPKYAFPSQEAVIKACADMCVSLSKVRADETDGWETMKRQRAGAGMVKFVRKESQDIEIKQEDAEVEGIKPDLDAMSVMKKANAKHRGRLLVVVGTYSIGKERICLGIARALNSKIYAPAGKQRICRALEDPEIDARMTSDPTEAQVHMTPLFEIRADTLDDYLKDYKDHFSRAVGFRPSGWNYRPPNSRFTDSPSVNTVLHSDNWKSNYTMKELVPQRGSTSRASCFGVPYSEHSSFRELTMFCCALRIEKIIPTVNVGSAKSREKMKGWCEKWLMERKKNGLFTLKEAEPWYLLRRAAARGLAAQSSTSTRLTSLTPLTSASSRAQSTWRATSVRFYSEAGKPSPAEAEGNQTAESEPPVAEQKQDIVSESVATSSTTDGATLTDAISSATSSTASKIREALPNSPFRDGRREGFSGPPPESKILYVGNLFFDLTPDKLRETFAEVGDVVNCKIVTDASGMSKGFGYVEFSTQEQATSAIAALNDATLEGRNMRVQYHQRRSNANPNAASRRPASNNPASSTLFVGNMSFQMSDKDLNELFRSVKGVVDVRVAIDRRSGQPRGFAHADFNNTENATAAKSVLENKVIYGRQLRVDYGLPGSSSRRPLPASRREEGGEDI